MAPGPGCGECTAPRTGPGGMPLALRLSDGLGRGVRSCWATAPLGPRCLAPLHATVLMASAALAPEWQWRLDELTEHLLSAARQRRRWLCSSTAGEAGARAGRERHGLRRSLQVRECDKSEA